MEKSPGRFPLLVTSVASNRTPAEVRPPPPPPVATKQRPALTAWTSCRQSTSAPPRKSPGLCTACDAPVLLSRRFYPQYYVTRTGGTQANLSQNRPMPRWKRPAHVHPPQVPRPLDGPRFGLDPRPRSCAISSPAAKEGSSPRAAAAAARPAGRSRRRRLRRRRTQHIGLVSIALSLGPASRVLRRLRPRRRRAGGRLRREVKQLAQQHPLAELPVGEGLGAVGVRVRGCSQQFLSVERGAVLSVERGRERPLRSPA
eukprot:COSAG01_NODE_1626_length_9689_cov_12.495412_3_plen_257_part_00